MLPGIEIFMKQNERTGSNYLSSLPVCLEIYPADKGVLMVTPPHSLDESIAALLWPVLLDTKCYLLPLFLFNQDKV